MRAEFMVKPFVGASHCRIPNPPNLQIDLGRFRSPIAWTPGRQSQPLEPGIMRRGYTRNEQRLLLEDTRSWILAYKSAF